MNDEQMMEMVNDYAQQIAFCMDNNTQEEIERLIEDFKVPEEITQDVAYACHEFYEEE